MTQLNIKKYFKIKKEKLRRAVIEHDYEPLSLRIVDTTNDDIDNVIYIARSLKNADNKSLHTIFENQDRTNIQFCPTHS